MSFPPIRYLDYAYKNYRNPKFDLASSGFTARELTGLAPDAATLTAPPAALAARLIDALAARYGVRPSQVVLTHGTTGAVSFISSALVERPGRDRIAVERPGYEPLWETPAGFGATVDRFERPEREGTFDLDLGLLEAAVRPDTRAAWITNPNNPSGKALPEEKIAGAAKVLARHGGYLHVDEVYLDYVHPLGARSAVRLGPNIVVSSSLTKVYGLGSLRVGWLVGPEEIAARAQIAQGHLLGSLCGPALAYASVAFDSLEALRREALAHAETRKRLVTERLARSRRIRWSPPDAGLVGVVRVEGVSDDMEFAARLQREEGIVLAPGSFFGIPGAFRLGFGAPDPGFTRGLERFIEICEKTPGRTG